MKTIVYTIEYGRFYTNEHGINQQECTNQPSFISIDEARKELQLYYSQCLPTFPEKVQPQNYDNGGYYLELYVGEFDLSDEEIKEIKEENNLIDATSRSWLSTELIIDNSGGIIHYEYNPLIKIPIGE